MIEKLKGFWNKIEPEKRKRLLVLGITLLCVVAVATALLNRTQYVVLYSDLSIDEAGVIYQKLEDMGVPVKMRGTSTLLVDAKQEDECRMTLTAEGYPKSGLSYDLYMDNVSIGTSESEKNQLLVFQLQDRLQDTIESLDGVDTAIVTLSIPDNNLFTLRGEQKDVTASVVLKLSGAVSSQNVEAIRNLVAGSVSGLSADNVSVVDTDMNLLSVRSDDGLSGTTDRFTLQQDLEDKLEKCVLSLLVPIFGSGQVKAAASVTLNFDASTIESVLYEPVVDGQGIAVSVEETKNKSSSTGNSGDSESSVIQTSTSYQVNQIVRTIQEAQGKVENLSVSVIINKESLDDETIEQIRSIAAYAVGSGTECINVVALPFAQTESQAVVTNGGGLPDWLNEKLIIGLFALVLVFILLLMVLNTFRKAKSPAKGEGQRPAGSGVERSAG
jgi:flagellar M-ring protein FliF